MPGRAAELVLGVPEGIFPLLVLLLQSPAECVCTCPVNHSRVVLQHLRGFSLSLKCLSLAIHLTALLV